MSVLYVCIAVKVEGPNFGRSHCTIPVVKKPQAMSKEIRYSISFPMFRILPDYIEPAQDAPLLTF